MVPPPTDLLAVTTARLRAAGCVFAEDEAALLLAHVDRPGDLEPLVVRRVAGEPLEHLLGHVDFAGLRLVVGPGVFVPRQRTVVLAERAAELAGAVTGPSTPVVVDLCCGCGAIAAVVAERVPTARVLGAELDPAAVAVARRNLEPRGASVHAGDLYDALPRDVRGHVDVLVVNAPYVPTAAIAGMPPEARDHEPGLALDGGPDGLDVHRRVAAAAHAWLAPGGYLLVETSEAQAGTTAALFTAAGLVASVEHDEERAATVVLGRRDGP